MPDVTTPLAVTPPAVVPADPATMAVDPAVGGALSTSDGSLSVVVPAGAPGDLLTLSLSHLLDGGQRNGNLSLGSQMFLVSVSTSAGDVLATFDQPLLVTIRPSADDVAAANGDLSSLVVMALDPDSGALAPLASTANPDGTITATVGRLGLPLAVTSSTPEVSPAEGEQSQPVLEGSSFVSEESALDLEIEALP